MENLCCALYVILSFTVAVENDWSEWSSWSLCSPTCYDGIQTRSRTCLNTTVNTTKEDISCNGTNREVLSCNEINCVDPPEVNILDAVYVSKLGEHVEMNYTHNNGTYEWLKENLPLSNDPTKYSDLYNNGTDFFTFVIHNIDSNDRGIYTINLKNAAGHANDTTVVKVVHSSVNSTEYELFANESVILFCSILDADRVKWWKGERNVDLISHYKKYHGGSLRKPSLTITRLDRKDRGLYRCESSVGDIVSKSEIIELFVKDFPYIESPTSSVTTLHGGNIVLPCDVNAYPKIKSISWTKNGEILAANEDKYSISKPNQPSLTVKSVTVDDSGYYSCNATNLVGSTLGQPIHLQVQEQDDEGALPVATIVIISLVGLFVFCLIIFSAILLHRKLLKKRTKTYEEISKLGQIGQGAVDSHVYEEEASGPVYFEVVDRPPSNSYTVLPSNTTENQIHYHTQTEPPALPSRGSDTFNHISSLEDQFKVLKAVSVEDGYEVLNRSREDVNLDQKTTKTNFISGILEIPTSETMEKFWEMIFWRKIKIIVLLARNNNQANDFCPSTDRPITLSTLVLKLQSEEQVDDISIISLNITKHEQEYIAMGTQMSLQVTMFKTVNVPKHSAVDSTCDLIKAVVGRNETHAVIIDSKLSSGNMCPESGIVAVCMNVAVQIEQEGQYNILEEAMIVKRMRNDLFVNFEEFEACYKTIDCYRNINKV